MTTLKTKSKHFQHNDLDCGIPRSRNDDIREKVDWLDISHVTFAVMQQPLISFRTKQRNASISSKKHNDYDLRKVNSTRVHQCGSSNFGQQFQTMLTTVNVKWLKKIIKSRRMLYKCHYIDKLDQL